MRQNQHHPARLSIVVSTRTGERPSKSARDVYAIFGYRLVSLTPTETRVRLARQTQALAALEDATAGFPPLSRAIELRYVAAPSARGSSGEVACYLLARVSARATRAEVRSAAMQFHDDLSDILETALNAYSFCPITTHDALLAALRPFQIADTVEFRHRLRPASGLPARTGEPALAVPLMGVPDADRCVELMLRQSSPVLWSISFEPEPTHAISAVGGLAEHGPFPLPEVAVGVVQRFSQFEDDRSVEAIARTHQAVTTARMQSYHLAALHERAFRMRLQVAAPERLRSSLIATLANEFGGAGALTAESAWQNPAHPAAGGADWARPRSARRPGMRQTEFALATENLASLGFASWGERDANTVASSNQTALADLGEATRLFALPTCSPWLPIREQALALPYRGASREGATLGVNRMRGLDTPVNLTAESRRHHLWIVGQTGTGKSTLLESLVLQDIDAGRGVIAIDPHGDLIQQVLGKIPARRARDVILFDPADTAFPMGLNPLEATGEDEQALVVSSFIGLLTKLYDPYHQGIVGPRFEHAARNGLLTVMSSPGGSLIEVVRVFQDESFARSLLPYVQDPLVKRYWTDQIARTNDFHKSEVLDWIVSKFGHFVTDPTLRRIIGQSRSGFSFRQAMDEGKIVLISLAKGLLGSENANFLGLILLPMILQAALSRANLAASERRDVSLYVDEFQNYATDSLALMMAEARKYRLSLTLANQHVGQLTSEIRDAVLGNVGSILAFRLGAADSIAMAQTLAPSPIQPEHLLGLPNFTAYGRLLTEGRHTQVFTLSTLPATRRANDTRAQAIRNRVRRVYTRPREEVDAAIRNRAKL